MSRLTPSNLSLDGYLVRAGSALEDVPTEIPGKQSNSNTYNLMMPLLFAQFLQETPFRGHRQCLWDLRRLQAWHKSFNFIEMAG